MEKTKTNKEGLLYRIVAAFCGALLTAFAWRVRGDHGFGGTWGMLAVSTALLWFVLVLFPKKGKMSMEFFACAAFLAAFTAGGWGTINSQLTGLLDSAAEFTGETAMRSVAISPISGVVTMLLLGFGWTPFLGFFLGQYFSKRSYSFLNAVEGVAVFYVAKNLFQFTISPFIYKLICPQAVTLFEDGLSDRGISKSPYAFFVSALGNIAKGKKIPGGRNYFTCIAVVSAALAAAVLICWIALRFKDKRCAGVMLGICCNMAVAITAADVFMLTKLSAAWGLWEYFTGFIFGGLTVALLYTLKADGSESVECFSAKKLPRWLQYVFGVISFAVAFCACEVVGAGNRIDETTYLANADSFVIPAYIVAAVIAVAVTAAFTVRSMAKRGMASPLGKAPDAAARVACPAVLSMLALLYFFIGSAYALNTPYSVITNMMVISFAAFCALYAILISKKTANNK